MAGVKITGRNLKRVPHFYSVPLKKISSLISDDVKLWSLFVTKKIKGNSKQLAGLQASFEL